MKTIVVIGAGNVASHLAPAIDATGAGRVTQVYSRTYESAEALARKLPGAVAICNIDEIQEDADVYLISLSDDAIVPFLNKLPLGIGRNALWLHTSGSVGMEVLSQVTDRYGVFYPLQTFSKNVELDINAVPLFIEGNTEEVEREIREFGEKVFKGIYYADSELRRKMHIAAVFACNFTNYLWIQASELLEKEGLPFDVLKPLLEETLRKSFDIGPLNAQTGPARRGDRKVTEIHKSMLEGEKSYLYGILSDSIINRYHPGEVS